MPAVILKRDGAWIRIPVQTPVSRLSVEPFCVEPWDRPLSHEEIDTCWLVGFGGCRHWALIVAVNTAVRHNGLPVSAGLRVLAHQDAVQIADREPLYFATDDVPRVQLHTGPESIRCPRCHSEVREGESIVRCPSCGIAHHEQEQRNCWTYASACSGCSQPTVVDAGLEWTPEEL